MNRAKPFLRSKARRSVAGFSVTELAISLGIVLLLFVLAVPSIRIFRDKAKGVKCINNLRQIGAATLQYATEHRGDIPFYPYNPTPETTGSGAAMGTWYYLLAPYLGVARTEVPSTVPLSEERTWLGSASQRIGQSCVFTCPGHRRTESNMHWSPEPMTFPALKPVSYAPPSTLVPTAWMKTQKTGLPHPSGYTIYPLKMHEITSLSRKVWLMDSPHPSQLNVSTSRWQTADVYKENWPRQGMTRHGDGGNVLYYDGHVEWLHINTFAKPSHRTIEQTLNLYLNPYRQVSSDE